MNAQTGQSEMRAQETAKAARAITKSTPRAGRLIFARMALGDTLEQACKKVAREMGLDAKELNGEMQRWSWTALNPERKS